MCFKTVGAEPGRHPCRLAPKIAIHGDFPLEIQHSVSEIADFSQRLETILYTVPVPAPPPAIKPSRPAAAAPEQTATTTNTALLPANVSDSVGSYVNPYLNYKI